MLLAYASLFLPYLKANPKTQAIPVILVTAKSPESVQESFAGLEVAAVFTKPFRPLKLAMAISEVLGWSEIGGA
ncbi:hypothetical protein [Limnofasciculus baicalensis]|uniref:Response regulatory domain-containing protein n=1 Tax=Limnofasciculus baicalensis BBK-W-15 TaxID=2699891 RepID=A0AAE3GMW3_9CYAN|nr:hypothetical protein [Limnofasciculus baicalensis]MCP2727324.1 hypothetical protein [Limnofasciculus baicalensis BBK-W-15]